MSSVKIHVQRGGKTSITTEGVAGERCTEASRPYREKLAGRVVSDVPTDEMHQAATEEEHQEQQQ